MSQGPRRLVGTHLGADIYAGGSSGSKTVGSKLGADIVVDRRILPKRTCTCHECQAKRSNNR